MARKSVALNLAQTMDYNKFKKLSWKEQKRITSILTSAMNKRIKRLGSTELGRLSPTYQAYEKRKAENIGNEGYYSIRGIKSSNELFNRFQSLGSSLQKATSLREWKSMRNDTLEKLSLDGISPDEEKAFWNMYRKFQEDNTRYKKYKKEISDKVLTYIAKAFEDKGYDYTEKSRKQITRWLKEEYEKDKQNAYQQQQARATSIYFNEDDESE